MYGRTLNPYPGSKGDFGGKYIGYTGLIAAMSLCEKNGTIGFYDIDQKLCVVFAALGHAPPDDVPS